MSGDLKNMETIKRLYAALKRSERDLSKLSEGVAIVGMACRFPGADNIDQFSEILESGADTWSAMPDNRWDPSENDKLTCKGGYFLKNPDLFDSTFFRISHAEARMMSPQQRLLLETSWHAFEHANILPAELKGSDTGVFMGIGPDDFGWLSNNDLTEDRKPHYISGNAISTASGRLSYFFGFEGPNISLNTACSSSLVAVDQAVQAIRLNKCSVALAGGVNLILLPQGFTALENMQALSPEGKCRGFDARANGYGRGEGCGVVILKNLSQAIEDGNKIWAVIKGSAVNQDGISNGLTAPNGSAQVKLMQSALKNAGLGAEEISFVEAHGTGTSLGDPIEIEALHKVYGKSRNSSEKLLVSSVKSNIGHLENAAGIAALIKAALSLHNGKIFPQAGYELPNPKIHFNELGVEVPPAAKNWPEDKNKKAGVSSFGFSGTNAHLILEEYQKAPAQHAENSGNLVFCLSAKNESSLNDLIHRYHRFIKNQNPNLADLCYTAACYRTHFNYRKAWVVSDIADLINKLDPSSDTRETGDSKSDEHASEWLREYMNGEFPDWMETFGKFNKITLPVYPFKQDLFEINYKTGARLTLNLENGDDHSQKVTKEKTDIPGFLCNLLSEITEIKVSDLNNDTDIFEYGVDSLMIMRIQKEVKSKLQVEIRLADIYGSLNTISRIAEYITAAQVNKDASDTKVSENTIITHDLSVTTEKKFVPYAPVQKQNAAISGVNGEALDKLIKAHNKQTQISKEWTQNYRKHLANNRNIANFRPPIKEMTYQIIADRAEGAYIFDPSGKRFLDMSMGFGVHLFGHNPSFLKAAISEQLEKGSALGPMSPKAGQLARAICEFTGNDRAAFYNSGTEAIMVALRLARAVSKKQKVVIFEGSYHGTFDGILGVSEDGKTTLPMAPGITPNLVADIVVLQYGDSCSLTIIEEMADQLAAVLVEPVQSRYPDLQPADFLSSLREITGEKEIALIFDEVITGFRLDPGGAQSYFGVKADLVVYGKVIGGGMPIGVVSGKKKYMDAVDGGFWSFGDDSYPKAENTFVAGTFCHHPLAMSAGLAVIYHLKQSPGLIKELNARTKTMCDELNDWFVKNDIPAEMVFMGSLFRFRIKTGMDLIYYYLLSEGIYIWEGRNCFISTAHTQEDISLFVSTVKKAFITLFPDSAQNGQPLHDYLALTPGQMEIWMATQRDLPQHVFHLTESFVLNGELDIEKYQQAFDETITSFDALSFGVSELEEGPSFIKNKNSLKGRLEILINKKACQDEIIEIAKRQHEHSFGLTKPPLWRAKLIIGSDQYYFIFTIHHIVCDGWSLELLFEALLSKYQALLNEDRNDIKSNPVSYKKYIREYNQALKEKKWKEQEEYWTEVVKKIKPVQSPFPFYLSQPGKEIHIDQKLSGNQLSSFYELHRRLKVTPFVLSAALVHITCQLKLDMSGVVSLSPVNGRYHEKFNHTVGHLLNMIPLFSDNLNFDSFVRYAEEFNVQTEKGYQNMEYPYTLIEEIWRKKYSNKEDQLTGIEVSFENFGWRNRAVDPSSSGLAVESLGNASIDMRKYPLEFRLSQFRDHINHTLVCDPDVIDYETGGKLLELWCLLLEWLNNNPDLSFIELSAKTADWDAKKHDFKDQQLKSKELEKLLQQKNDINEP